MRNFWLRFARIFLTIFFLCVAVFSRSFAEQPKYILFDNFEDRRFLDSAYWIYLTDPNFMPEISPYVIRKPFNDATLQQFKLTDFDVAIFVLGDYRLNTRVGNANVLNAIRQMISAGKNCLIIGRNVLYYAFNPSGGDLNPEVQKFLSDTLGIEYLTRLRVSRQDGQTITYWSFNIRGAFGDPVGQSVIKWCNINFNTGREIWTPLAHYLAFDVFKSKDPVKYPPVDHFIRTNNDYPDDTIVGIRSEIGTARLCFWSIGFEAFAGDIPRGTQLARAMYWLKGNIAPDGAAYELDPLLIDFGEVKPGETDELELKITSTGKLDLVLEEIDFWENQDNVFEIVSGKITKAKTLKRGQSHIVKIRFSPKERISYYGQLSIKSNALYNEYRYVDIYGYGGGLESKGPIIATNFAGGKINFGKVRKPTSKIIELVLKNVGDRQLQIDVFEIDKTYKDHERFDFAQVVQKPLYIEAGDSVTVKVRFSAAAVEERVYYGRIRIVSNSKENSELYIELEGEIEGIQSSVENDNFVEIFFSPNENSLSIFGKELSTDFLSVVVTDILGKVVEQYSFAIEKNGIFSRILTFNHLSKGIYFVNIKDGKNRTLFPILILD
ncbi:MAG: choice-of-anchor D domain-containing protein [Ignavibacteria bacterium]|nr:choice-of-anchor D domain-containing protein [Ignavibacteria bacterium]